MYLTKTKQNKKTPYKTKPKKYYLLIYTFEINKPDRSEYQYGVQIEESNKNWHDLWVLCKRHFKKSFPSVFALQSHEKFFVLILRRSIFLLRGGGGRIIVSAIGISRPFFSKFTNRFSYIWIFRTSTPPLLSQPPPTL